MTENYIIIDKKEIFYRCLFKNNSNENYPWLIFLHEALGSTTQFYNFPQLVAEKLQANILLYDRWGHGKSSEQLSDRAVDFHYHEVDFLVKLLAKLNITQFYCIGHSDGGVIALLSACKRIEGLQAVVSISAMSERSNKLVDIIYQTINNELFADTIKALHKHHHGKENQVINNWIKTWGIADMKAIGLLDIVHKIDVPVLLMHGVFDQYGGTQHLHNLVAKIPHANQHLLAKAKHHPHLEESAEVTQVIGQFLQSSGVKSVD